MDVIEVKLLLNMVEIFFLFMFILMNWVNVLVL